ncbi:DNA/RNA endonuclease G (NUC1) [Arcicella aurantiaca]|uniref:DNA/RNA endonuclease G (NUC1) n=1 Tax=Arcicella aurantiaca TaxID=591202 RepID=A0A316EDI6_9BACT|nr:DNA/RNA non-specific endonuclease [Arcicella aurantiaca]PWK28659.1 DNA/RNA endonuclease G (NUC1) [Arcicella aurantiaca]
MNQIRTLSRVLTNTRLNLLRFIVFSFFLLIVSCFGSFGQTYYDMSLGNYSETFTSWTTPSTNSWSSVAVSAGTIPSATATTVASVAFSSGTSGGVQNGSTNIQFLSTGTSDNSSAVALDLNLNFTNRNAGTLTFDAASVVNSTGNRAGSLKVYYATNGTTWTELTGTNLPFTANNNVAKSANISIPLPSALNNQGTVKLRFYYHNGGPATSPTGSRPKISIDNVTVTGLSTGPTITVNPNSLTNLNYFTGNGPSSAGNYNVIGSSLTGDITLTVNDNFEISTSASAGFGNTLTLTPNAGSLNTPIYARLIAGLSVGTYSGSIAHSGGSAPTSPTVSLSGTVADIVLPTTLAITSITPTSPSPNTAFIVNIQAQDNNQNPQNVAMATTVSLSLNTGTGTLGGTLTGVIPAGENSVAISGVTYDKEELGVILTATVVSGDALSAVNSPAISIIDNTPSAIIRSVKSGNWNDPTSWTCNCIPALSDTVRVRNTHVITVINSDLEQGCAKLIVDTGGTLNIQTATFKVNFPVVPVQSTNINLAMGNPSNATTAISNENNYLLEKPQYVMSYSRAKATSNWVSWYLNSASIGSTTRQNDFRNDTSLPSGWYQVTNTDYSGSGFDRGHMTPSGDRTSTVANNSATFLMTNMIPQAPDNNQGPWEGLESYLRGQLGSNQEIYIIAGSYGVGGTGSAGTVSTIAGGKITVPAQTFKIAVILPNGDDDANRVSTSTRVIAIIMPNVQGIRTNDWRTYRTTVDAIEAATGYNFLSNVPTAIQNVIEAQVDTVSN